MEIYQPGAAWIFGKKPTILDGHVVPFIARLLDCERQDLIPDALQNYATSQIASPQWHRVMHGRPTMWNPSLGHVSDMAAEYNGSMDR